MLSIAEEAARLVQEAERQSIDAGTKHRGLQASLPSFDLWDGGTKYKQSVTPSGRLHISGGSYPPVQAVRFAIWILQTFVPMTDEVRR